MQTGLEALKFHEPKQRLKAQISLLQRVSSNEFEPQNQTTMKRLFV
jgi:hypothetical protein